MRLSLYNTPAQTCALPGVAYTQLACVGHFSTALTGCVFLFVFPIDFHNESHSDNK
jgi:hypothetical protein